MYIHCSQCFFEVGDVIPPASVHGRSATNPSGIPHPRDDRYMTPHMFIARDAPSPRDITGGVWSDYRYRYRVWPVGDLEADPQFGVGGAWRIAALAP